MRRSRLAKVVAILGALLLIAGTVVLIVTVATHAGNCMEVTCAHEIVAAALCGGGILLIIIGMALLPLPTR